MQQNQKLGTQPNAKRRGCAIGSNRFQENISEPLEPLTSFGQRS
jgi:hypothetical protein